MDIFDIYFHNPIAAFCYLFGYIAVLHLVDRYRGRRRIVLSFGFMASPICPTSCEKIHYDYSSINYSNHINNSNNTTTTCRQTMLPSFAAAGGDGAATERQRSVIYPTRNQHNDRPGHGELVRLANYEPVSRCNSQTGYRSAHPSCSRDTAG